MNKDTTRAVKLLTIAINNEDEKNIIKHSEIVSASRHIITKEEIKDNKILSQLFSSVDKDNKKEV